MSGVFGDVSELFLLDKDVAYCNHGSYGTLPKCVFEQKMKYDSELERNPDLWMRRTSIELWHRNRQAIAPYLGTRETNIAFVHNTTSGANAALSSICWKPGDVILVTGDTYPAVRCACDDVTVRHEGIQVSVIQLPYPAEDEEQYVKAFASAADFFIEKGKTPRLAVVDAISSKPGIRYPFEKIVKALKQRCVEVFVDGAHTPGQIDLNLDALGVDYFAGNLHKWFFTPRGTAVFWVAPKHQATIRGPVVSFDNSKLLPKQFTDPMAGRFYWQGTTQNTGFACVTEVLKFCESLGGIQNIMAHNKQLADEAYAMVLSELPESCGIGIPESCIAPSLRNFFAPPTFAGKGEDLDVELFEKERVWVCTGQLAGKLFVRMSCQIYNKLDDYRKLVTAIKHFSSTSCQ